MYEAHSVNVDRQRVAPSERSCKTHHQSHQPLACLFSPLHTDDLCMLQAVKVGQAGLSKEFLMVLYYIICRR